MRIRIAKNISRFSVELLYPHTNYNSSFWIRTFKKPKFNKEKYFDDVATTEKFSSTKTIVTFATFWWAISQ